MIIDYRELLKRYMQHVADMEGVYFLEQGAFTINDLIILQKIEQEINDEYESKSG